MSRRYPPSFDFFPDDFAAGTVDMDAIEVGMYIRYLCYEWGKGSIPNDREKLVRIGGVSNKEFEDHWESVKVKFVKNAEGDLVNEKLEDIRQKQLRRIRAREEAGRLGGCSKARNLLVAKAKQKASKGKVVGGRRKEEEKKKEKESKIEFKPEGVEIPELLATEAFRSGWSEWLAWRAVSDRPYRTAQGVKTQLTKLGKLGADRAVAAIENSISREWIGIYEESGNGQAGPGRARGDPRGNLAALQEYTEEVEADDGE